MPTKATIHLPIHLNVASPIEERSIPYRIKPKVSTTMTIRISRSFGLINPLLFTQV